MGGLRLGARCVAAARGEGLSVADRAPLRLSQEALAAAEPVFFLCRIGARPARDTPGPTAQPALPAWGRVSPIGTPQSGLGDPHRRRPWCVTDPPAPRAPCPGRDVCPRGDGGHRADPPVAV